MKKHLIIFSLFLFILSCKDDDPVGEESGSILVNVYHDGKLISDVEISTDPLTSSTFTDDSGTVLLSGLPADVYRIIANHPTKGSGSASVNVENNARLEVDIILNGSVFANPIVTILNPATSSTYNVRSHILFSGNVNDESDNPSDLQVIWNSDIDGELNTDQALGSGFTTFTTNELSLGAHTITLSALDSDNLRGLDQIFVTIANRPDAVRLDTITASVDGLLLNWTVSTELDFDRYLIMRRENPNEAFEFIHVINDINRTIYADAEATVGVPYEYQIRVVLANGQESESNIESYLIEGAHIDIGVNIKKMIIDPRRPYIYALGRYNNSLLFINSETKSVDKTIFVGSSPTDIDMNHDNSRAYIADSDSRDIAVIDLETQEKIKDITVDSLAGTYHVNPYSLVWLTGNYLAYVVPGQSTEIRVIDAETGIFVSSGGNVQSFVLETNPARNVIYSNDHNDVVRFNVSTDGELEQVDETEGFHNNSGKIVVSRDDQFILSGEDKMRSNNLAIVIGSFGERVFACNEDASIVIGETRIWDGNNYSVISPLPVHSTVIEVDDDNERVYVFDESSDKIFILEI